MLKHDLPLHPPPMCRQSILAVANPRRSAHPRFRPERRPVIRRPALRRRQPILLNRGLADFSGAKSRYDALDAQSFDREMHVRRCHIIDRNQVLGTGGKHDDQIRLGLHGDVLSWLASRRAHSECAIASDGYIHE
jgi:hypothetical protein